MTQSMEERGRQAAIMLRSTRNVLDLIEKVHGLDRMLRAELVRLTGSRAAADHLRVLTYLAHRGDGVTATKLSQVMDWPKATTSRVLRGMLEAGWIETMVFDDDGRKRTIWISEAGQAHWDILQGQVGMALMSLEMDFRLGQISTLREVAVDMANAIEARRRGPKARRPRDGQPRGH